MRYSRHLLSEGRNGMSYLEWGSGRVTSGEQNKRQKVELTSVTKELTEVSTEGGGGKGKR